MSRLLLCFHATPAPQASKICARAQTSKKFASGDPVEFIKRALSNAQSSQMAIGSFTGFATGYATKRLGQLILVLVGCELLVLQMMAERAWIIVNWDRISTDLSPHVKGDRLDRVVDGVKRKMPFAGTFSAAFYMGFKWT